MGSVRTNQMITTYGVGALVAIGDESFIVAGIDRWVRAEPTIEEPRLQRQLQVVGFALPPTSDDSVYGDVPVFRFPLTYYCPSCKVLQAHHRFCNFDEHVCTRCDDQPELVPSRFIVGCPYGHLDDFPYFKWVHSGSERKEGDHRLHFEAAGLTSALADVQIRCSCGQIASMEGAFGAKALAEFGHCSGRRPWLSGPNESCDQISRTLQRGASNVWYPVLKSALSIPPWSDAALKIVSKHWGLLKHLADDQLEGVLTGLLGDRASAGGAAFSVSEIAAAVRQRRNDETVTQEEDTLREQEFDALIRGREETVAGQDFTCVVGEVSQSVSPYIDRIRLVTRLREVRAMTGFTRLFAAGEGDVDTSRQVAALARDDVPWLPAIEVTGEGVFITIEEQRLSSWEAQSSTLLRVNAINRSLARKAAAFGRSSAGDVPPRLVLAHTLAHALIDQWSLDCGYPAASLRERLYINEHAAGILIYTATSDSAGSLGGVVSMGQPETFEASLREALARASWCSADPLCLEAGTQGVDSLNLAACHSCVLLPETCCEHFNTLLDRALLIGVPDDPGLGFFSRFVE
jgi:hypothetical protein